MRKKKQASGLWYLLPIFLGIIGGIIGYFVLKDRDPKKAKNVLNLGIVFLVIGISIVVVSISLALLTSNLSEVPQTSINVPAPSIKETIISVPESEESSSVEVLGVGNSAIGSDLTVTLNGVRFTSEIDEQDNQFSVEKAPPGEEYVITDITVENVGDESTIVSTLLLATVKDQDGFDYTLDLLGTIALDKGFKDGELSPGFKKRGELSFLVPDDATDLKFFFVFNPVFPVNTAVFDIK